MPHSPEYANQLKRDHIEREKRDAINKLYKVIDINLHKTRSFLFNQSGAYYNKCYWDMLYINGVLSALVEAYEAVGWNVIIERTNNSINLTFEEA